MGPSAPRCEFETLRAQIGRVVLSFAAWASTWRTWQRPRGCSCCRSSSRSCLGRARGTSSRRRRDHSFEAPRPLRKRPRDHGGQRRRDRIGGGDASRRADLHLRLAGARRGAAQRIDDRPGTWADAGHRGHQRPAAGGVLGGPVTSVRVATSRRTVRSRRRWMSSSPPGPTPSSAPRARQRGAARRHWWPSDSRCPALGLGEDGVVDHRRQQRHQLRPHCHPRRLPLGRRRRSHHDRPRGRMRARPP